MNDTNDRDLHAIPDQAALWDQQHQMRGTVGMEAEELRDKPSESAIVFSEYLKAKPSLILEVGCAHGRDARYWASLGHDVICTDFSIVALGQLRQLAEEQGLNGRLRPMLYDINSGRLPDIGTKPLDGFYSRSALHVNDAKMMSIASQLNHALVPGGVILIEGKGLADHKIRRGVQVDDGLVLDPHEGGHLRRAWSEDFMRMMCEKNGWDIKQLEHRQEAYHGNTIDFLRLIAIRP